MIYKRSDRLPGKQTELSNEFVRSSGGVELPRNLQDVHFSFDNDHVTDCRFGYSTKPLLLLDNIGGQIFDPRELKGLFYDDNYLGLVSRHYAVIPHEVVEEYQQPLIDKGFLTLIEKYPSKDGLAMTWNFETPNSFTVDGSPVKDDKFRVQVVYRNSVNGGIALSATVRTFREVCTNGLMGWGIDFQSKLAHYGDVKEKLLVFKRATEHVSTYGERMEELLEKTIRIKVAEEHLQYILDKTNLALNYIPDWIHVEDTKTGAKVLGVAKDRKDKTTLYDTVNDFTWLLSRAEKSHPEHNKVKGELSFAGITTREQALTRAVAKIVKAGGKVPA